MTCWGYAGLKTNPTKVAGATDVVALAAKAGGEDTCALTKAGALTCWSGYKLEATPLALVLQREYIDEPEDGCFVHVRQERITEWPVAFLSRPRRTPQTLPNFFAPDAPANRLDILRGLA